MLFFRSEVHVGRWYQGKTRARGETFRREQLWSLAQKWYGDRLAAEFNGRTPAEVQHIFRAVGLTSSFWQAAEG